MSIAPRIPWSPALLALALAACSPEENLGGVHGDASASVDLGTADAGQANPDAASTVDAEATDALENLDAAAQLDAEPEDLGAPDSGRRRRDGGGMGMDSGAAVDAAPGQDALPGQDASPGPDAGPLTPGGPLLYFSDLIEGPKSGNSDDSLGQTAGTDGAIISIWGTHLGAQQGASTITINGAPARVYYWGPAVPPHSPARLDNGYTHVDLIEAQIDHTAADGLGQISVVVGGVSSNAIPFTVRPGRIVFAKTTGNDRTGDGSFQRPYGSILGAKAALAAGDIAYLGDGLRQTAEDNYSGAVDLDREGAPGQNIAMVAYPGAQVFIGDPSLRLAFSSWNTNKGGYSDYWTISKLELVALETVTSMREAWRVVGNKVSAPNGSAPEGTIATDGSNSAVLGNELTQCGSNPSTKLYHPIYVSGDRTNSGPILPTVSNREIAWNYLHDNIAHRGINIYTEGTSSAPMRNHQVHDNVIVDQSGDGILIGNGMIGETLVYNNLVVRAGTGPDMPGEDTTGHVCLEINAGLDNVPASQSVVKVYNNTFYGCGQAGLPESGVLSMSTANFTLDFRNNIIVSSEPYAINDMPPAGSSSHNLWFGRGAAPSFEPGAITQDPRVVDPRTNFRLQPGSPARGAADAAAALICPLDLEGVLRTSAAAVDLGAYQSTP
ncbi:MAG: choice-of-anchor Q domain-containing protein [Myxococcota bacterium]